MKFYIDTEFNGFGGELISFALVPASKTDNSLYVTLETEDAIVPWVKQNVVPYLKKIPEDISVVGGYDVPRAEAAKLLAQYFRNFEDMPTLVADWPEDFAQLLNLMITGPGTMVNVPDFNIEYRACRGFNTADHSTIPHNALADAIALRDYFVNQ